MGLGGRAVGSPSVSWGGVASRPLVARVGRRLSSSAGRLAQIARLTWAGPLLRSGMEFFPRMKIILTLLLLPGFFGSAATAREADLENTARAYNGLGFQLLAQCRQSLPKTNYFLSPAGLAFALSMVQNGARGETWGQIMATLQAGNMPQAQLNQANKALLGHLLKLDPKIKLEIANAIWIVPSWGWA